MFRLLKESEIECRVKKCTEKGAIILLYKTARTDMDILDEIVGPENWQSDYKDIKGNLYCGIGILVAENRDVWKWDCGIESREDDDGNQKKGEASDAFKRAGFKWGIGRELYTAPFIFIPAAEVNIKRPEQGKTRFSTFDTFSVERISYDQDRRISGICIRNDKTGRICFDWKRASAGGQTALDERIKRAMGFLLTTGQYAGMELQNVWRKDLSYIRAVKNDPNAPPDLLEAISVFSDYVRGLNKQ